MQIERSKNMVLMMVMGKEKKGELGNEEERKEELEKEGIGTAEGTKTEEETELVGEAGEAEGEETEGRRLPSSARELLRDQSGIGVVEIILILVILIGLVVIFKSQITSIVETIFEAITSGVSDVVE